MDCSCPPDETLATILAEVCGLDLKQIQRLAFQRYQTVAPFTPTTILDLAEWQGYLTATDDTKIVVTPIIGGDPIIEAGDKIVTGGGDNSTMNGIEEFEGVNPAEFSCVFKSLLTATEVAMKKLICQPNLTVYLFLKGGRIAYANIASPAGGKGFEIHSVFLSDRNVNGFGAKDTHAMSFYLTEGYSETLAVVKPAFNPLTDLITS